MKNCFYLANNLPQKDLELFNNTPVTSSISQQNHGVTITGFVLDGAKIVYMSYTHAGLKVKNRWMENIVEVNGKVAHYLFVDLTTNRMHLVNIHGMTTNSLTTRCVEQYIKPFVR